VAQTTLAVVVKPSARHPGISLRDGVVEVRVAAPPRDGLANEAVRAAIAAALGCPKRAVTLQRGAAARHKTFAIAGLSAAEVAARLAGLPPNAGVRPLP
jgi:uncharacterized protein YggU (UPF0235/DUF167 family)